MTTSILIAGYYGRKNAGDEWILQGILHGLRRSVDGELDFIVLSGDPEDTRALHEVASISWTDTEAVRAAVDRSDLVLVGGGGLLQDHWGVDEVGFLTRWQGGISEYGAPVVLAQLSGVPSMFYGLGVGPLTSDAGKALSRRLVEAVDRISVRDRASIDLLASIGVDPARVDLAADPALVAPANALPAEVDDWLRSLPAPVWGVSLRHWELGVDPERWSQQIAQALDACLDRFGGSVLFVPFQVGELALEDDRRAADRVAQSMQHKAAVVQTPTDLNALQRPALLQACDVLLAMRLHAAIAALAAARPFVALAYDPKVRAFCDQLDRGEDCLALEDLDAQALTARLAANLEAREAVEAGLRLQFESLQSRARRNAQIAAELLDKKGRKPGAQPLLRDLVLGQAKRLDEMHQTWLHSQEALQAHAALEAERDGFQQTLDGARNEIVGLKERLDGVEMARLQTEASLKYLQQEYEQVEEQKTVLEAQLQQRQAEKDQTDRALTEAQGRIFWLESERRRIEGSMGWKVLWTFWQLVWRLRQGPLGWLLRLSRGLRTLVGLPIKALRTFGRVFLPQSWRRWDATARMGRYEPHDISSVRLYTDQDDLFPNHLTRCKLAGIQATPLAVTLVATSRNEIDNLDGWLSDLMAQTRKPDEVVIVDAGSKDGTLERLQAFAKESPFTVRILVEPGANIARGRNLAVEKASHSILACTDLGCSLAPDWLEKLLLPFNDDPELEVIAGWYEARPRRDGGRQAQRELVPSLQNVQPQHFLPSSRSFAFRRETWARVGGYPEWLTLTGEDTFFALELKRTSRHWAFVPDAVVFWHGPESLGEYYRKLVAWARGDGESGVLAEMYWRRTVRLLFGLPLMFAVFFLSLGLLAVDWRLGLGLLILEGLWGLALVIAWSRRRRASLRSLPYQAVGVLARSIGFLQGLRRRPEINQRRYADLAGITLLLSGVPIDDTGGGSRASMIAQELLRRGSLVQYVHKYPKYESLELGIKIVHPCLRHHAYSDFDWKAFAWAYGELLKEKALVVLIEFPMREYLALAREAREAYEAVVVYDLLDEWDSSLGGDWYSPRVEREVADLSQVLVASAPALEKHLVDRTARRPYLIPNAVNLNLFDRHQTYARPVDLPSGDPVVLYIGALWGEWFDWDLLLKVAQARPQATLVVIGDYRGQAPGSTANLHFLGLRPQTSLPAYLAHSDVAMIPWKVSPITHATSPLKIYEYLAMGVPVVAPRLHALEGLPYVLLAEDDQDFIRRMDEAASIEPDAALLDAFLARNSWAARIDSLGMVVAQHALRVSKGAKVGW